MLLKGLAALGLTLGGYGLSKIPEMERERVLAAGPNDPDDPKGFTFNPLQKLLLEEESVRKQYYKRNRKKLFEDTDVRTRINELGLKESDIGEKSRAEFLADTLKDYKTLQAKENLIEKNRSVKGFNEYLQGRGVNDISLGELSQNISRLRRADVTTPEGALLREQDDREKRLEVADDRYNTREKKDEDRYNDRLRREQQIFAAQQAQQNLTNQMQLNQLESAREERRFDREDRKEERALRREDARRKEQQQMMLMLMRGLQQGLGSLS